MLRNPAIRTTLRSLQAPPTKASLRLNSRTIAPFNAQFTSRLCTLSSKRPQVYAIALQKLNTTYLRQSYADKKVEVVDHINAKAEDEAHKHRMAKDPEHVSSTSSIHPVFSEIGTPNPEPDTDMMAGVKADLVCLFVLSWDTVGKLISLRKLSKKLSICQKSHGRLLSWVSQACYRMLQLLAQRCFALTISIMRIYTGMDT